MNEQVEYCHRCGSTNIRMNGHNACGSKQYHCLDCGVYRVLRPKVKYSDVERERILRAYRSGKSMRQIQREFGISRQTLAKWLKHKGVHFLSLI